MKILSVGDTFMGSLVVSISNSKIDGVRINLLNGDRYTQEEVEMFFKP
jgi:hypothetical protein